MLSNSLDMDVHINQDVLKNLDKYNFQRTNCYGKDDELDAFRSAYRYGFVTLFYGEKVAKTLLQKDIKEDDTKTFDSVNSMSMKLWNAKVGINAGNNILKATKGHNYDLGEIKEALSNKIVHEMKKGHMKTNTFDRRRYEDFDFEKASGVNVSGYTGLSANGESLMPTPNAPSGYHYEQTPCVGSYEVSGYTRADGTEVEDYIRTCGASHLELIKDGMSLDDDGGSDGDDASSDGSTDDEDSPVLNGSVEQDSYPDGGGDVYTTDGGDGPEEGGEEDNSVINPVSIFATVISAIVPSLLNAVLTSASDLPNGSEDKEAINRLNTSTQTLNNSQEIQKQALERFSEQINKTKDKSRRGQLQKESSKIKNEHYKTQVLVDKINNSVKNKDYERVVEEINAYNNKRNSVDTSNQPIDKQSETRDSRRVSDSNYILKGSVSSDSTQGNSNKVESNSGQNTREVPKEVENAGKVLSGGNTVNEFIMALGKDINVNSDTIKKVLAKYKSSVGKKIEESYKEKVRDGIEKILKEWTDATKAIKLAGEIAEEISPYLTSIDIFVETYEGYNQGGKREAKKVLIKTIFVEVVLPIILANIGVEALPAFAISLIIDYLLKIIN